MKIDGKLDAFLTYLWAEDLKKQVRETLVKVPEPKPGGIVCARTITGPGTIDPNILVITEAKIGYGWPMVQVLWRKK